ncbi:hypothetical protein GOP47_0019825 [Adiantum capillus-veneris]|uniref:Uncharacterized protein n=1 Tax=Adiantum capillus-veneris TaxID=13818 RepID=A0A9D4UC90_ADICA|nr:hypothetical protein GOP47_0019825 [Adiantum capillus-veneris]
MGKRKLAQLSDSDEEEDEKASVPPKDSGEGGSDEENSADPKPLGEVIKRVGRGKLEKRYYQAFELDGNRYEIEDPVLVTPEERNQKPYVAIIKEIKQSKDGGIAVTGQWFYRPEEADKKSGGSWVSSDSRDLFYSFHRDEVAAESVMHKCVVHFIPAHKQAPLRSKHPGFIVRKVYDPTEKKLWNLTDKDYEDSKQAEINLLVQKTRDALGELLDIEHEDGVGDQEITDKGRRQARRRTILPLNINKEDHLPGDLSSREGFGRPDTPGSALPGDPLSEAYSVLLENRALTRNKARDRWLEKLVQGVKYVFKLEKQTGSTENVSKDKTTGDKGSPVSGSKAQEIAEAEDLTWPAAAVAAVTCLERTAFESLSSDMHKYNLKMRQLEFNLKNSSKLAQRLLKQELDASKVLNMSPAELKDGLTAEEKSAQEPEELETMQMADVRCTICSEKKVGVKDIIHVGYGDRYQLECLKCGHTWYSSRDSIAALSIQTVSPKLTVGAAPWATSKFDEVEKDLMSPREGGQATQEIQTAAEQTDEIPRVPTENVHSTPVPTEVQAPEQENVTLQHWGGSRVLVKSNTVEDQIWRTKGKSLS